MAINLTASQKSIRTLFFNTDQYVIPEFQRPYSWGYEQCYQLYCDLLESFNNSDSYFVGNIILARSNEKLEYPEIIDGQQRMLTLWILLKVLSVFDDEVDLENTVLKLKAWRKGESDRVKIISKVYANQDGDNIKSLLAYNKLQFTQTLSEVKYGEQVKYTSCTSNIQYAALLFFSWLSQEDISSDIRGKFTDYLLDKVSLLPIELGGDNQVEALDKALTIFETINNRGMDLSDADIFKARLYSKALSDNKEQSFINQWNMLTDSVNTLAISIDEVFRAYYHIIRGKNGITVAEKKLRDFFMNDSLSPLSYKDYGELMSDLFRIVEIFGWIRTNMHTTSKVAAWLQILYFYTNSYPQYAIVAFLYNNTKYDEVKFIAFLKILARYVYYIGSTTTVKFEIYSIIHKTMLGFALNDYIQLDFSIQDYSYSSRLLTGISLLAYYNSGKDTIANPIVEKVIKNSDIETYGIHSYKYDFINTIGNTMVVSQPLGRLSIEERLSYANKIVSISPNQLTNDYGYSARREWAEKSIISFFTGK